MKYSMFNKVSIFVGARFTISSGKASRLVSFISILAISGLVLGVAILILVISVMNGFEQELKDRVLNVIPHASIYGLNPIDDWEDVEINLREDTNIRGISPYIETEALIKSKSAVAGVLVNGVIASKDKSVSVIHEFMQTGNFEKIQKVTENIKKAIKLNSILPNTLFESIPFFTSHDFVT